MDIRGSERESNVKTGAISTINVLSISKTQIKNTKQIIVRILQAKVLREDKYSCGRASPAA